MVVSLKESHACTEMARILYGFLPGSGHSTWKGHVSFSTVAKKVGVGNFWPEGSKEPAIARLLESTLEHKRECFEPLILEIVKEGLKYKRKRGESVTEDEIKTLNGLILEVGLKFPSLWDQSFLASLRADGTTRAANFVEEELKAQKLKSGEQAVFHKTLVDLKKQFYTLAQLVNRQAAGKELEGVLNKLFALFKLTPREAFRVVGEEIDGSFELDNAVYLLEAKWEAMRLSEAPLLVFHGKIEGKSTFTRGLFVALNGVTEEAIDAIHRGKQPNFILLDGYDLSVVLEGQIQLDTLLRAKVRHLAEEGAMFFSVKNLISK